MWDNLAGTLHSQHPPPPALPFPKPKHPHLPQSTPHSPPPNLLNERLSFEG